MVYWEKLKNSFIIFGISSLLICLFLFLKIVFPQSDFCRSGYLESPIFDFGTTSTFNKFLWFGTKENSKVIFAFCISDDISSLNNSCSEITDSAPGEIVLLSNLEERKTGRYMKYIVNMESCDETVIPRVDRIFLYYNK